MRRITIALALILMLTTSVVFVLGQNDPEPPLQITIENETCRLTVADPAAALPDFAAASTDAVATAEAVSTAEAQATAESTAESTAEPTVTYPLLTLGTGCNYITPLLHVPSNGVLWLALSVPGEFPWQQFRTVPGDPNPPKLDTRGRFVGCANPVQGTQTCYLLWDYMTSTYLVEIPLTVRSPYVAPIAPTNTPQPISTPAPANSGVWGDCGSCTTCGGPVEHCVLAPDNQCLWDAERCEPKGTGTPLPTVAPST